MCPLPHKLGLLMHPQSPPPKKGITEKERKKKKEKTSVSGGDRCELSVCSIHPQFDAHMTKVWK
jgi:hypothetical protein